MFHVELLEQSLQQTNGKERGARGLFIPGSQIVRRRKRYGGGGNVADAIRKRCAGLFKDRLPKLVDIVNDAKSRPSDVIAAMALIAKVGIPTQTEQQTDITVNWNIPTGWGTDGLQPARVDSAD